MNENTRPQRTSTSMRRVAPALAIVVLAIGLGACQTPQQAATPQSPVVHSVPAHVPAGIESGWTADRQEAALEREAVRAEELAHAYPGVPADRVDDRLARETTTTAAPAPEAAVEIAPQLTR